MSPKTEMKPGAVWLSLGEGRLALELYEAGKQLYRDVISYLWWLMAWRTASSNSMGPGMRSVGRDIVVVVFVVVVIDRVEGDCESLF